MQGWRPCSVKLLLLRDPKQWKPDEIRQNILRKILTQKRGVLPMMMMMMMKKLYNIVLYFLYLILVG
jgi:hypothetical protein